MPITTKLKGGIKKVKFNFRKIASVLASAVMVSSTVALSAAVSYPAPFVSGGVGDVAVVYGSTADLAAVADITSNLNSKILTEATTTAGAGVSGGDYIKLERATDKFNLGDEMDEFYSSLDDEELSAVLKSGIYQNDNNDEFDFEQSISLAPGLALEHFADSELDEDEVPVIGFNLNSGDAILNYTLDFTDNAEADGAWVAGNALETTEITMLGRNYYVVSARNTTAEEPKITLLDTANSAMVVEGEATSISVNGVTYDVSIEFINGDEVILNINGVKTNKLGEGDTYKVAEDLYVSVKDILYSEKESGISKVDVSLGSGKIVLENEQEVQINNEDISTSTDSVLNSYIVRDGEDLESITLEWILDDDAWIVPGRDLVLPGFETIKFSMGGFKIDTTEVTELEPDGDDSIKVDTIIKDGSVSLNLFYLNSTNTGIVGLGEKDSHKLVTNATTGSRIRLNETENSYFVATWISGDDAESYAFEIQSIAEEEGKNKTTLKNLADDSELVFSEVGKVKDVGSLQLTLEAANDNLKTATIALGANSGTTYSDRVITKDGLRIRLPVNAPTTGDGNINLSYVGGNPTSWVMNFTEETKDGDIQIGDSVAVTIAVDGDDGIEPTTLGGVTSIETSDGSDQYEAYVLSELATRFWIDKPTTGLNKLKVEYNGKEVYGEVFVSETGAIITGGVVGSLSVMDSEAATAAAGKNWIVVGGSCVNTVAADLLGGALCEADFTTATGVGAGSYLIKTFERAGTTKIATLVAGYNAADTANAAKALTTVSTIDLTAGMAYTGSTATTVEAVVAAA